MGLPDRRSSVPSAPIMRGAWILLSLGTSLSAQTTWSEWETLTGHRRSSAVYDTARDVVVLHGGETVHGWTADTFERVAERWHRRWPAASPSIRNHPSMTYDSARGVTVLFGGSTQTFLPGNDETWEWNGATWLQRTLDPRPPIRFHAAMAFDSARRVVVLFGGGQANLLLGDTWEYDGTRWTLRTPATNPVVRMRAGMAFDAARSRIVMFGGEGPSGRLDDTWEWDGVDWVLRPTTRRPQLSRFGPLVADARGVTLHGGVDPNGSLASATWRFDGTDWTQIATGPTRFEHALAYDARRGKLLLFGGYDGRVQRSETFELEGSTWTRVDGVPTGRVGPSLVANRDGVVLFGGQTDTEDEGKTWTFTAGAWQRHTVASPPPRQFAATAHDAARDVVVLFGGADASGPRADHHEWNGSAWTQRFPTTLPPARSRGAMAYDFRRQRTVLVGGMAGTTALDDHWEWDGQDWIDRSPAQRLPAGVVHVAYHGPRGDLVAYVPMQGTAPSRTFLFDGSNWVERLPVTRPMVVAGCAMTSDEVRGVVVLIGMESGVLRALEWDGFEWTRRSLPFAIPGRSEFGLAFAEDQVLLFGGSRADLRPDELVGYRSLHPAVARPFGTGCGTVAATLRAEPYRLAWPGTTFEARVSGLPVGATSWLHVGASNTTFAGIPLPIDLGAIGMPGCALRTDVLLSLPLANFGGSALWRLPIPPRSEFVGATLFLQGFFADGQANSAGIGNSAGLQMVIGTR